MSTRLFFVRAQASGVGTEHTHSSTVALLADLDLVGLGHEPVLLVSTVAESHQRGPAAPALCLNNLPIDDDQVGTVLS